MLKKLLSFLFEEEEIVEEVPDIKEETKLIIEPLSEKKLSRIDVDQESSQQSVAPISKPIVQEPKPIEQPIIKKEPLPPIVEKPKRQEVAYEFSSAISPIFGKLKQEEKTPIIVQPKIAFEESESILGTIISPIYGVKKNKKPEKVQKQVPSKPKPMSLEDILGVNEETQSVAVQMDLDNTLDQVQPKEKEEILMQLFEEDVD
jgi:virulence-associated protein VagC